MNNITPIHQNMPSQQDWWPHPEHPIWPPQGTCGPQPAPPSCFSPIAKADACWDQSQALYNLVSKVVMDIFTKNPGIIPPPPAAAGSGPRIGVTDGSLAQPGQVGEYVQLQDTRAWSIATGSGATQTGQFIVQPGDWDVMLFGYCDFPFSSFNFYVSPVPAGLSNNLGAVAEVSGTAVQPSDITISGPMAQLSAAIPTLIAPTIAITNSTGTALSGHSYLILSCRRMR